jgi:hypothetical protein
MTLNPHPQALALVCVGGYSHGHKDPGGLYCLRMRDPEPCTPRTSSWHSTSGDWQPANSLGITCVGAL